MEQNYECKELLAEGNSCILAQTLRKVFTLFCGGVFEGRRSLLTSIGGEGFKRRLAVSPPEKFLKIVSHETAFRTN